MIMRSRIFRTAVAGLILAAFFALNLMAGPLLTNEPQKPAGKEAKKAPANIEALLIDAYADLDRADHDYKGHRIKAMEQIEAAGKLVHLNLRGDGHGHEKQGVSDEQLRLAEGVLNQIKTEFTEKKHSGVLHHVNKALEQLTGALKIK
jgi:hypothetical protein